MLLLVALVQSSEDACSPPKFLLPNGTCADDCGSYKLSADGTKCLTTCPTKEEYESEEGDRCLFACPSGQIAKNNACVPEAECTQYVSFDGLRCTSDCTYDGDHFLLNSAETHCVVACE